VSDPVPTADRLGAHDLLYLASSNASLPLSVAGLFLVGRDPAGSRLTAERLEAHLAERLHLLPRFRQVVRPLPLRLATPAWVDDDAFSLSRHVRAHTLPAPGSRRELEAFVARLNDRVLDPRYPLWEAHVLDGFDGDATPLLLRWHHAMVDGMSAVRVTRALLDGPGLAERRARPAPADTGPMRPHEPDPEAGSLEGWLALLRASAGKARFSPGRGRARWAGAAFPEREMRAAARRLGVSLNELVAALPAGALAHVLAARGDSRPDDSVRTLVPIVLPSAARDDGLGNHGAHFVTRLPVAQMDEEARVQRVAEALRQGRRSGQVEAIARGMERLEGAPVPVIVLFARIAGVTGAGESGAIDLIVSFMPGPKRRVSLAGFPLEAVFPVLPIGPRARLTVGGVSLGGTVGIGVTAGTDVLPELDLFVHGLVRSASQLGVAGGGTVGR
jgi:diacylglycerol O-acyltransferase / wax synthase